MKLKTKLSKLRHDGHITDAEYSIIINVLNKFSTQPPKTQTCEDCISRQEAIKEFQIYREYSSNRSNTDWVDRIETVLMHLPPVIPQAKPCEDAISRQMAIDEIEYEIEMINSALDTTTLDFNARERLRQRRGEAKEILNSIQQFPSVTPQPKIGHWIIDIKDSDYCICSECKHRFDVDHLKLSWDIYDFPPSCPNCGAKMGVEK